MSDTLLKLNQYRGIPLDGRPTGVEFPLDCPYCTNSGGIPVQVGPDDWVEEQCEWCHTTPHSRFNWDRR